MTGMLRGMGLLAALVLLVGCRGGGSTDEATEPCASAPTSSEPTPVETDECRSTMDQADSIATELETATIEDGAAFGQYEDRLTALYKRASQSCNPRVSVDFGEALRSFARVSAGYEACSFMDSMFQCDVSEDLIKGTSLIHKAAATAVATA